MSISEYIAILRREIEKLDTFGFAESIDFRDELRAGKQAIIKIEVFLVDGSTLVIRESLSRRINQISISGLKISGQGGSNELCNL